MPKLYYFRSPNLDINPESETAPRLGSIYCDIGSFGLSGPLNRQDRLPVPLELCSSGATSTFSATSGSSVNGSAGLNITGAGTNASVLGQSGAGGLVYTFKSDQSESYRCSLLETTEFLPTDDFVAVSVGASPHVRNYLETAVFGRRRVYMITGLKVAADLAMDTAGNTRHGPRLTIGPPGTAGGFPMPASLHLELEAGRNGGVSGTAVNEVIFAYKAIRVRSRLDGKVKFDYRSGGKYGVGDDGEDDGEEELDNTGTSPWELDFLTEQDRARDFSECHPVQITADGAESRL
ncbi:hypothetical protein MAPG_06722 [Magnaporthiopsis poae ATCC 64411]|uniref:Uncharacterized protein n=1 Tax=Magnaporthiopsis poae (strain ATCC 64411 / 73-15) TaxID=644358 RepID=A0A0C4E2T2_MAGP6|nr:hypothetical protein MAPG_06722 [Magnaporthiopsis poae ATCC 64411]